MSDKEQIKELKEQLAEIQAKVDRLEKDNIDKTNNRFERVNYGKDYYHIGFGCSNNNNKGFHISTETEDGSEYDGMCFAAKNYFHTKERAEEVTDKIKFLLKLERLHDILCPDYVPDWENYSEEKYFIFWGCLDDKYDWSNVQTIKTEDDVYFPNKETVQKACDMLNCGQI